MRLRCMVLSAAAAALGLVLPVGFHAVGLGSQFLPMLLPLLVNGFLSTPGWAAATGLLTPLASALLTGMPPLAPPLALIVSIEGAVLGAVAAILWRWTQPRIWPPLLAAVASSRAAHFVAVWWLAERLDLPPALSSGAALLHGLPGVALQLAVTPLVVRFAQTRGGPLFGHGTSRQAPLL